MSFFQNITIVSGGQTGVDRAALDFALSRNIKCGGWSPKGRKAEDGKIDRRYPLSETSTTDYPSRTKKNIQESDGTLILYRASFDAGTALTLKLCKLLQKPCLLIRLESVDNKAAVKQWIEKNNIIILNIAGPRESSDRGIYENAIEFLNNLI